VRDTIGASLVRAGVLGEQDLDAALAEQARTGERLGAVLVRLNLATEDRIARVLAAQLGFPVVRLAERPPDPRAARLIPEAVARAHVCIGLELDGRSLTIAFADPLQFGLVQELESRTGCRIRTTVAPAAEIVGALDTTFGTPPQVHAERVDAGEDVGGATLQAETSPAERLDALIDGAGSASDVHFDPLPGRIVVRHRMDGELIVAGELSVDAYEALVAHVKRSARMDERETRLPQEGWLRIAKAGGERAFQVSTIRTLYGEKIRLRAAGPPRLPPTLDALGMSERDIERLVLSLRGPSGLVLAVGPSGSGRTTTICAALSGLDIQSRDVIALGDHAEYDLRGVTQVPIATSRAEALDAALRQDPDIVLVDTLDDGEAAVRAVQAVQNGCLVVSTVTADDAAGAVQRLVDFEIDRPSVVSALAAVITQRLVRRLCRHCRRRHELSDDTRRRLDLSPAESGDETFDKGPGCAACAHTGYRGRVGLFEVMPVRGAARAHLAVGEFDRARAAVAAAGVTTLQEDALVKMMSGTTSADELLRVVGAIGGARRLCAACGFPVSGDFVACPRCGGRLGGSCARCGRALLPAWRFCPYCG